MALPKQRHTHYRRDRARKQFDVPLVNIQTCPKCKAPISSHRVCAKCGTYKGRVMVDKTPKLKAEKKAA